MTNPTENATVLDEVMKWEINNLLNMNSSSAVPADMLLFDCCLFSGLLLHYLTHFQWKRMEVGLLDLLCIIPWDEIVKYGIPYIRAKVESRQSEETIKKWDKF